MFLLHFLSCYPLGVNKRVYFNKPKNLSSSQNNTTEENTFSLSAISTNIRVKGGGDYYLISRTLGLEFGSAIGIVLFLAQLVSIGFSVWENSTVIDARQKKGDKTTKQRNGVYLDRMDGIIRAPLRTRSSRSEILL